MSDKITRRQAIKQMGVATVTGVAIKVRLATEP